MSEKPNKIVLSIMEIFDTYQREIKHEEHFAQPSVVAALLTIAHMLELMS